MQIENRNVGLHFCAIKIFCWLLYKKYFCTLLSFGVPCDFDSEMTTSTKDTTTTAPKLESKATKVEWYWVVAAKESDVNEFRKNDFSLEINLTSTGLMDDMCEWLEEAPFDIVGHVNQSQGDPWYIWNHKFTTINVPHDNVIKHCMDFQTGAYFTRNIKITRQMPMLLKL